MHIIYIHQYFITPDQEGGTRSYEMAKRLVQAGHKVSMICGTPDSICSSRVINDHIDGIDVYRIVEPYSNYMSFARRWIAFLRFAKQALKVAKTLREVDLVFATSTPLTVGPLGRKAAQYHGCPFVFEVRDLWPELPIAMGLVNNPLLRWYLKNMELKTYRAASHCIALSPRMKEGIAETGFPEDRITLIPNSCDNDLFLPTDSRSELDQNSRYGNPGDLNVVYAGTHGLINGLDAVLEAICELKKRNICGVHFNFIGDGAKKPSLISQAEKMSISEYVSWFDPMKKNDLAGILPQMDVGLLIFQNIPAIYNGTSPNKFFDYIASGIPVLSNYPGWLAKYIDANKCGVVVPPDDPMEFADAVVDMINHQEKLKEMGKNARMLAETTFSRDILGQLFVETLEKTHDEFQKKAL